MLKKDHLFLVILIFLIKSIECDKNKCDDRSLYKNSTAIISASPANLKQLINGKPYSSLVFFYQNWCEECIDQVNVNLELEKEIVYWQNVLKMITINYDSQIARDFNVSSSFEYKLSRPEIRSNRLMSIDSNDVKTKDDLIKSILSALLKLNKTNNQFTKMGWPKLKPLDELDGEILFTNTTLLFVNKDSTIEETMISLETILDFSAFTSQFEILHCNESVFTSSNADKEHQNFPALYQFKETEKKFGLVGQALNREEFRNLTIARFLASDWKSIEVNTESKIKNLTRDQDQIIKLFPVYSRDLNNALRKIIFNDFTQ